QPGLPPRPADGHVDAPLQFHLDEAQVQAYDLPADEIYEVPASAREPHVEVLSFEELIAGAAQPSTDGALPPPLPAEPVTAAAEPARNEAPAPAPIGDFSSWSLLDDDGYQAPAA